MSVFRALCLGWSRRHGSLLPRARRTTRTPGTTEALEVRSLLAGTNPFGLLSFDAATGNAYRTITDSASNSFTENQSVIASLGTTTSTGAARRWDYAQVADFNGDTFNDIAVYDHTDRQWWVVNSNFELFESTGAWFTASASIGWGGTAAWTKVFAEDFTGDGRADIAMLGTDNRWLMLASDGTSLFLDSDRVRWDFERNWTDVLTGDFNGDGAEDILGRTVGSNQWWVITHRVEVGFDGVERSVWDSRRWGTFTEAWMNNTTWVDTIVGDFNGDGFDDVITRSQQGGGLWGMVSAASQGGQFIDRSTTFGFQPAQYAGALWRLGDWRDVKVGDFNGDGRDDMLARNAISNQWTVTFGTSALISATVNKPRLLGQHVGAEFWNAGWQNITNFVDVVVADFNGDGVDDVAARSQQGGGVFVMLADGSGKVFAAEQWWGAWNKNIAWKGVDTTYFGLPKPLIPEEFLLHSYSGAKKIIYLDFTGHVTSGTAWRGGQTLTTPVYDLDGDPTTFNLAELTVIRQVWERVAEDFAPFDVDVTTQEPTDDQIYRRGGTDTEWGIRVAIGGASDDWYSDPNVNGDEVGGVAYVGTFGQEFYGPAFVFVANLGRSNAKNIAEASSHEVGHTLGLSHDGTSSVEYYGGHGSGPTGWAPIMGVGYSRNLTQWSKGEYADANQLQDDLARITRVQNFGYRVDDHGSTLLTATDVTFDAAKRFTATGVIGQNTDVDYFRFVSDGSLLNIEVDPFYRGPNLDIQAEIYSSTGVLLATSNPTDDLNASFVNLALPAGTYFLKIDGVGKGDPLGTGYTDYGSLGQFTIRAGLGVSASSSALVAAGMDQGPSMSLLVQGLNGVHTLSADGQLIHGYPLPTQDPTARPQPHGPSCCCAGCVAAIAGSSEPTATDSSADQRVSRREARQLRRQDRQNG